MWKLWSLIAKRKKSSGSSSPKNKPRFDSLFEPRERTFYVIFCDSAPHWLSFLCKQGFNHCYLIEKLEHIYMMVDPTRCGLNISIPPCSAQHDLIYHMKKLDPNLTVVKVITKESTQEPVFKPKLLNCVSILQHALGVSFPFFCLTPFQLYRSLLKKHPHIATAKEL